MVIEVGCPLGLAWWGVGGGPCLTLGTRQWFYGLHKRRGICYHQSDCQCRVALGIGIEVCFNRTNCCSRPEQPVLAEWLRQVDGGWNHQVQFKSENNPSQPHFKVTQGRTENYTRCIHTKLGTDSWLLHLKYSSALTPSDQIWNGKSCDQYPHKINFKSYLWASLPPLGGNSDSWRRNPTTNWSSCTGENLQLAVMTALHEFSVTYQVRCRALGVLHTSRRISNSDFISYPDVTLIVTRDNGSCPYGRTPCASWLGALSPHTPPQSHIRDSTPEISPRGKQGDLCIWNMWNVMSISEIYVIVWSWCVVLCEGRGLHIHFE